MNMKKNIFRINRLSLLIGEACAASVNDFNIDNTYKSVYNGKY